MSDVTIKLRYNNPQTSTTREDIRDIQDALMCQRMKLLLDDGAGTTWHFKVDCLEQTTNIVAADCVEFQFRGKLVDDLGFDD